jgi:hypothetical protein
LDKSFNSQREGGVVPTLNIDKIQALIDKKNKKYPDFQILSAPWLITVILPHNEDHWFLLVFLGSYVKKQVVKGLYGLFLLMIVAINTHAQEIPADTVKNKQYYLWKSKSQKTAGWIIFGVGATALLTGVTVRAAETSFYIVTIGSSSNSSNAPEILMIGGAVFMVGSIPLFISAHDNKLKTIQLSIGPKMEENAELSQMYVGKYQPAISFKIKL